MKLDVKLDTSASRVLAGSIALSAGVVVGLAGLRRRPRGAQPCIGDVMSRHPASIDSAASAQGAARRMAEEGVGALAVCDRRGRPVGVLTDRDMVLRLLVQAEDPRHTTVGDCLEGDVATVNAEDSLSAAASRMRSHAVRRLPVVRDGHLVGIVTQADLAHHDPPSAASLERELTRAPRDERSAAWLFRRSYRDSAEP